MKRSITIISCFSILIVLLYGIFSLILFDTSAKYTDYKELNHYFESKELYISSPSLSSQNNKYNIINYYNFTSIPIEIINSIDNTKITNYDIEYNLECKILNNNEHYSCIIDETNNTINSTLLSTKMCIEDNALTEEECLLQEYNYKLIKTINNHTLRIINIDGTEKTLEVELILNTTSPYFKTLKSTYILNIGNDLNNEINISESKDYNYFCEYNIINNYYTDTKIKLTINTNNLIFDTTNNIYHNKIDYTLDNNNNLNTITFILTNNQKIKLYKKDFKYNCNNNDIEYVIID